ncbi:MAG TPA: DUF5938 domain-containing protein [Terriglobales bacterium]|nr:DUF5938 domain-containing protein [Terriglobales bacterium]
MPDKRPVILYGASGFSGRLAAEFLREYNVPFMAAGRNGAKIKEVMSRVPGIETANYEIVEVGGSVKALAKLFTGAKVVCNTVGPCLYYGADVIGAAWQAGCHYLDISAEQAWLRQVAEKWGEKFAAKGLVAAPGTAFMSAVSDAAVHWCLEEAGAIDTLEILTMFKGIPTFGSTQTIFAVIPTDAYYLEQNQYRPWPRAMPHEVVVPGSITTRLALPWGGFPHPVWYKDHPRIANVRCLGGLLDRQIMQTVAATERHFEQEIRPLPKKEQERKLAEMASSVQGGTPPPENTREQRTVDIVVGRGTTDFVQCVVLGTCAYRTTGLLQAYAAHHLIHAAPRRVGFASPAAAFGHRELLKALEGYGLSKARLCG